MTLFGPHICLSCKMPIPRSLPQKRKRDEIPNKEKSPEPASKKAKRGRKKRAVETVTSSPEPGTKTLRQGRKKPAVETVTSSTEPVTKKLKRGRPKKLPGKTVTSTTEPVTKKLKRGRPKKFAGKTVTSTTEPATKKLIRGRKKPTVETATDSSKNANRQYFHTSTVPFKPNEILEEDSSDGEDVRIEMANRRIERNPTLTALQKKMMNLWNTHTTKTSKIYRGAIVHMSPLCLDFVEKHKSELSQEGLHMEFLFHLTNLHEQGILSRGHMVEILNKLPAVKKATL
ncbi:unnamed protein product [Orchesella dallaii]|uniref:Polycomb protein VEFS-Box domain-containing protein n=1 Tax=Orchesella dallaii TaxID=48710 RepID=A0ABP1R399_9HEXA